MEIMTYEEWVDGILDYNWWEWCYETFTSEMMDDYSVEVDDISFSGFWSQGDGAIFTGKVKDITQFLDATGIVLDHLAYNELARNDPSCTSIVFKRHGYNSMAGFAEVEECDSLDAFIDMPLVSSGIFTGRAWTEVSALVEYNKLEAQITGWARDRCNALYRMLEAEYESLTSMEAYEEWVKENYKGEDDV